jgi:hypothetical protein
MRSTENEKAIPSPASAEAIAQGCTCPVEVNRAGRGIDPATSGPRRREVDAELRCFRFAVDCRLHGHGEWLMNLD